MFRAFSEGQDGEIGHIQKISKDKNGAEWHFSLQALLVQKLKISTLDGAKSTQDIKFELHWVQ